MTEDRDRDVQDWFKRSSEELPRQPFTLAVTEQVRRRERHLRLQLYTARLAAFFSFYLLLPELIAPLNRLAALPLSIVAVGGAQWPVLVVLAMGGAYSLVRQARNMGVFASRLS